MENRLEKGRDTTGHITSPVIVAGNTIINTPVLDIAIQIVNSVVNDSNNPLEAVAALKRIAAAMKLVFKNDDLKDHINAEFSKFGGGPTIHGNAIVTRAPTHTDYDYKVCGNLEYNALFNIMLTVKKRMQDIEKKLKDVTVPKEEVYRFLPVLHEEESGEVSTVYPPVKKQTWGLKFTMQ